MLKAVFILATCALFVSAKSQGRSILTPEPHSQNAAIQAELVQLRRLKTLKAQRVVHSADLKVPRKFLVMLFDGDEDNSLSDEVSQHCEEVKPRKMDDVALLSLTCDESYIEELLLNPRVARVEDEMVLKADNTNTWSFQEGPTWGLDRIDQYVGTNSEFCYMTPDCGDVPCDVVDVYVLDTGVFNDGLEFGDRVKRTKGFSSYGDDPCNDTDGHGTHVAGTIGSLTYGVAKFVNIIPVKVLDNGSGTLSTLVDGMDFVTKNAKPNKSVVNMSLGFGGSSPTCDLNVRRMHGAGVTVVVAAGNSGANACEFSPAKEKKAITVACSDQDDNLCWFSNFGSCVDIIAPGLGITSIIPNNRTAAWSGTSMSAPHVTGFVASLLQTLGGLSPAEVSRELKKQATSDAVDLPKQMRTTSRLLHLQCEGTTK